MISTNNQLDRYSKRMNETTIISNTCLYTLNTVAPFYSITLKDFNILLGFKVATINKARAIAIILYHLNQYPRSYQTKILNLYQLNYRIVKPVINDLLANGYLKDGVKSTRANLAAYVPVKVYSLTLKGKELLNRIDSTLSLKIAGIKKVK